MTIGYVYLTYLGSPLISIVSEQIRYSYRMKTKPLTLLLALTFLFLFSGSSMGFAHE